jgi:hypothetical protein
MMAVLRGFVTAVLRCLAAGTRQALGFSLVAFGFQHVDDEAGQRLKDLADRVLAILTAAGIPASARENPGQDGGAVITVDTGADEAGGVYVAWQLPRAQHDELLSYLEAGLRSHPAVEYSFEVWRAMREAIMAILNAAGLTAARSEDHNDTDPLKVHVSG